MRSEVDEFLKSALSDSLNARQEEEAVRDRNRERELQQRVSPTTESPGDPGVYVPQ